MNKFTYILDKEAILAINKKTTAIYGGYFFVIFLIGILACAFYSLRFRVFGV